MTYRYADPAPDPEGLAGCHTVTSWFSPTIALSIHAGDDPQVLASVDWAESQNDLLIGDDDTTLHECDRSTVTGTNFAAFMDDRADVLSDAILGVINPVVDPNTGTRYTLHVDHGSRAVGFRCEQPNGRVEYLMLNPTSNIEGWDDPDATVFVYQGETGDPAIDGAIVHFVVLDRPYGGASVATANDNVRELWAHPDLGDWQTEVRNGDTVRGFRLWLSEREATNGTCDECGAMIPDAPAGQIRRCPVNASHDPYSDNFRNGGDPVVDYDGEELDPEDDLCRVASCRASTANGEGWDGYCGNCADIVEAHNEGDHATEPREDCPRCKES